jgi:photosystem II stability/assembly factor-like uncharacterized protein
MLQGIPLFLFLVCFSAFASRNASAAEPFTLAWTEGHCPTCRTAREVTDIQFVTAREAWAIGYAAPGGEGGGEHIVIHTRDGGKTWRELGWTSVHNFAPLISFATRHDGFISVKDIPEAQEDLRRTRDGGRSWRRLGVRAPDLSTLQYLGSGLGYATGRVFVNGQEANAIFTTRDGGVTWHRNLMQDAISINHLQFLSRQRGWVTGTSDDQARVGWTADAGKTWQYAGIASPEPVADVRDLFMLDGRNGWLVTWGFNNDGSRLFRTVDGGKNWESVPDAVFQGTDTWISTVRFLDLRRGFVFYEKNDFQGEEQKRLVTDSGKPEEQVSPVARLAYTEDGGTHWQHLDLPYRVHSCQFVRPDLQCSARATMGGFFLLRLHPETIPPNRRQ